MILSVIIYVILRDFGNNPWVQDLDEFSNRNGEQKFLFLSLVNRKGAMITLRKRA